MKNAFVYWIRNITHTDVNKQGYVGVARDVENRIYRHKLEASKGQHQNNILQEVLFNDDTTIDVIFYGKEEDCYLKEFELRPTYRIGWNIVPGGQGGSTTLGMKYSKEFCENRSKMMIGNKIAKGNHKPKSKEHKQKISLGITGRVPTEEHRKKQSLAMKGRKQSPESNEKRRLANLGKKRGPYKKKNEQLVT
jgi:hypothetical protein